MFLSEFVNNETPRIILLLELPFLFVMHWLNISIQEKKIREINVFKIHYSGYSLGKVPNWYLIEEVKYLIGKIRTKFNLLEI